MKSKTKIRILSSFIILIGLISVRIGVNKYMKEKEIEKQEIIEHFKPSIEIYLKTYYKNIDIVTVDTIRRVPTGDLCLKGYVNNDKSLTIHSFIDYIEKNGELIPVIKIVQTNREIDKMIKEEFKYSIPYTAYELLEQQKAKENKME